MNIIIPVSIAFATCVTSIAAADSPAAEDAVPQRFEFKYDPSHDTVRTHDATSDIAFTALGAPAFGSVGSTRWSVQGGIGIDVKRSENKLGLLGLGISHFIFENLSLDAELNAMFFDQRGSDAFGGNLNFLFRWHFFAQETWSIYLDGGAGVLFTTRDVPSNGSSFNFTPQAGLGVSFDIGNDMRILTGVRWHHISNASTYRSNPGRDSVMGYAGLSMPF